MSGRSKGDLLSDAVALLDEHPGLRLHPTRDGAFRVAGDLRFRAEAAGYPEISDCYEIEICVDHRFPRVIPKAREVGGRIPPDYHTNGDGTLCLGSPIGVRAKLAGATDLRDYVRTCVVPYLYGHAHWERFGTVPFGDLEHGNPGLGADYEAIFQVASPATAFECVRLLSLRKRVANKRRCPCGSGRRLGRCHNRVLNPLRTVAPRSWFSGHYRDVMRISPRPRKGSGRET